MSVRSQKHPHGAQSETELRALVDGIAGEIGEGFFGALVENFARVMNTMGAWVTEYDREAARLKSIAFLMKGERLDGYEYAIENTPCAPVVEDADLIYCPDRIIDLYPQDPDLPKFGAVSYMGLPLLDDEGLVMGHLAVLDDKPMREAERAEALMRIFAARAAAEMMRLRAEREIREREAHLAGVIGSAMDAIVELDEDLRVVLMNPAAREIFRVDEAASTGADFGRFLTAAARAKLADLAAGIRDRIECATSEDAAARADRATIWVPGGFRARRDDGDEFEAEATLACFEMGGHRFFTLVLRDVNERLEAERRIRELENREAYLREELRASRGAGQIIGESAPMRQVRLEIQQVAATDATVLILGETGTGKELVAQAIHETSARRDGPMIRVNCAAVPANLIESEFFGHERGAFTGATARREGRFALADGGTIFLDEVGELPLELQGKLLRVLQEGEFEPVGSSRTRKVDVRVIAATNRDLKSECDRGRFREDLYYRLNVFPLRLPPLRERGEDVLLLARSFADWCSAKMGRRPARLSEADRQRLLAYDWPGNVRELQNVIERALIIASDGRIDLAGPLAAVRIENRSASSADSPLSSAPGERPLSTGAPHDSSGDSPPAERIFTDAELKQLERENIVRAMDACGWKVAGESGAAAMLGMKPTTLNSRLKALGIEKPSTSRS